MRISKTNCSRVIGGALIAGCAALTITASLSADEATKNIVIAFEDIRFPALQPLGTSTAAMEYVWKDPATGGGSGLIRFTKGSTDRHLHTFDYQLVVIKGIVTHWTETMPEAGKKQLPPGSYWYQPAGQIHQDTCLSDECVMFMNKFKGGETKREADLKR